ncbi:MAG TPA: helix-turn-helix domain-containing protein [Patescibacteria group bacterium]|jgi:sugar-specific transcriptional regulator TrmB|nr:helix-turn-helix domain-containing protein [Patescibacteria group bacterium]
MTNDISPMHEYFAKLGLEPEIAEIYLALNAYGTQSLLQLARNSKVERTRLYRLIDTLVDCHLIEIETQYKRKLYKAAPISNLQVLLSRKEQELRDLRLDLHHLQSNFQQNSISSPLTHVQFYKGEEGVKQMYWNQTKAQSESFSLLYENMQNKTNLAFFERWVERCNKRDLKFRSIVGTHFLTTQKDWYTDHDNEKLKFWEGRYIKSDIYSITHSMVTYDDVVAYYNWRDGEAFGIEVYNREIADSQRQFFEILWQKSVPIPGHGEKPIIQ